MAEAVKQKGGYNGRYFRGSTHTKQAAMEKTSRERGEMWKCTNLRQAALKART
jgi:hypothetical protein